LKDQLVGATKEVFGAVFNENLHDAGAEQRIRGEREFEEMRQASPRSESSSWSTPLQSSSGPSEPSKTWFGAIFGSSEATAPVSEPTDSSRMSALKDTYVGATKEVVGAVFNEDLRNAGAEQRIRGESASLSSETAPQDASKNWSDPSEPSKVLAMKDQILGATKEVLGAVFSENLHNAGVDQRIHGEREYEIAVMAQEKQANWDQTAGSAKATAGQVLDNKMMQAEGETQQRQAEIKKVLNA